MDVAYHRPWVYTERYHATSRSGNKSCDQKLSEANAKRHKVGKTVEHLAQASSFEIVYLWNETYEDWFGYKAVVLLESKSIAELLLSWKYCLWNCTKSRYAGSIEDLPAQWHCHHGNAIYWWYTTLVSGQRWPNGGHFRLLAGAPARCVQRIDHHI